MLVMGINRILKLVQITSGGKSYTCPTQEINGELFFIFKKSLHKVMDFTSEHTTELISVGGKIIDRKLNK
ncbi:hypothetical protein AAC978_09025 [Desulfitobacterium sp. THU1]|uniref:hypothetical protein n=1 Tax=Desulfitobacterium sp. THU1 TaxID=3138072 RepID=UPI00311E909D